MIGRSGSRIFYLRSIFEKFIEVEQSENMSDLLVHMKYF